MPVPIACSLTAAGARAQLDEWRDVLGASVTGTHRISPTELSFRLRGDLAQLVAITRLAQREKACCPFFGFTIRIDADAVTLHVCVPDEAAPVLDRFGPLATPGAGRR